MSAALGLLEPTRLLAEAMAVTGLLALLVVAYLHPRRRVAAGVSVVAIALVLASGLLPLAEVGSTVVDLAPVVALPATILVVSEVCDRADLFTAAGGLLRRSATRRCWPRCSGSTSTPGSPSPARWPPCCGAAP